jgi:hypothetical protein
MLCHSNKDLKDFLNEAKDHKVVLEKVDEGGSKILFMNYNHLLLEKIALQQLDIKEEKN